MKNMKKVVSGLLCAALIASNGIGVFAAENPNVKKLVDDHKECNLYDHFDMTFDEFVAAAGADLKAAGVEFDGKHQMVYLSADEDGYTSYAVMMHQKETDENVDYTVDFDAKSGRIHSVEIQNPDQDVMQKQFEISLKAVGATDEDIEALSVILTSDETFVETETIEVSKSVLDDYTIIGIEPLWGSQEEEGPELADKDKPDCVKAADKLIADTKECGSDDMDVTYGDFVKAVAPVMKEKNVDITKCATTFTVYVNEDYATCDMVATSYSNDEDDLDTYFSVDYDKDNDKLHDIYYDFTTIEDACDVTEAILPVLGLEAADVEEVISSMKAAAESDDDVDLEIGDYWFVMYNMGDVYDVSIYKL